MLVRKPDDEGFGLVELIIAIFLFAVITVALVPALISGIVYSAQQSTTATATRQLNALVEQARQAPTCASLAGAAAMQSFKDGSGQPFTTSGTVGTCTSGTAVSLALTAKDQKGATIGIVNALVYVP
jgi:type II secretory pathway pseudopilin PulG